MKRVTPGSRQQKIADSIISDIQNRIYQQGDKLPSLRFLGSKYGVSHETVKLAMESLKEKGILNIIPGSGAFVNITSETASGNSNIVGVLVDSGLPSHDPLLVDPLFDRFFILANRELSKFSYNQLTLDVCFEQEEDRFNLIRAIEKVDGFIVISLNSPSLQRVLRQCGKPCVALIPAIEVNDFDSVGIDEFSTFYNTTREIIKRGYQKISYFGGPENYYSYFRRKNGIMSACHDSGLEFKDNNVFRSLEWGFEPYCEAIRKWLEGNPDTDTLLTSNDNFAISALKVFNEKGIVVPDDIALVGAKNTFHSQSTLPLLSTIDYKYDLLIRHAVERLMVRIEKRNLNPEPINMIFTGKLIIRDSLK